MSMTAEQSLADLTETEKAAARSISPVLWGRRFNNDGPMVHARGPWWPAELRRLARRWRLLADRAETCAAAIERHG